MPLKYAFMTALMEKIVTKNGKMISLGVILRDRMKKIAQENGKIIFLSVSSRRNIIFRTIFRRTK